VKESSVEWVPAGCQSGPGPGPLWPDSVRFYWVQQGHLNTVGPCLGNYWMAPSSGDLQ
jgi:hypothetical protein